MTLSHRPLVEIWNPKAANQIRELTDPQSEAQRQLLQWLNRPPESGEDMPAGTPERVLWHRFITALQAHGMY